MEILGKLRKRPTPNSLQIRLFVPDATYPNVEDELSTLDSINFKSGLETEFKLSFTYVNIGPGADLPAFQTILDNVPAAVLIGLGIFFAGNKVHQNLEAWIKVARRIRSFFPRKPVLEREGAALIILEHINMEEMKPTEIRLVAYEKLSFATNGRVKTPVPKEIEENGSPQYLSMIVHNFVIEVNGRRKHYTVNGSSVEQHAEHRRKRKKTA